MKEKSHRVRLGWFAASLLFLAGFLLAANAFAHESRSAHLWVKVRNNVVHVVAYQHSGLPIKNARVLVYDTYGKLLLEGKTNEAGEFTFPPPVGAPMSIVVIAEDGQRVIYELKYKNRAPERTPPPEPENSPTPEPTGDLSESP